LSNFIESRFFTAFFEVMKNRVFWSKFDFQRHVKHAKIVLNDKKLTFLVIRPLNGRQDFFFENRLVGTLGGSAAALSNGIIGTAAPDDRPHMDKTPSERNVSSHFLKIAK
jgi:hypothetical protein